MHIAIVGAGALGLMFGGFLAVKGHATVTLIVRKGRENDRPDVLLESVATGERTTWTKPLRATSIPDDADAILVCVRREQLDDVLLETLARSEKPVVVLSPMMPKLYEEWKSSLGPNLVTGMPSVVAYVNDHGSLRYWLPSVSPVLIDESRPAIAIVNELAETLSRAGIRTRLELGVHETNPAITVTLAPWFVAVGIAGSVEALLQNDALLGLTERATGEARELGTRVGTMPVAGHLTRFLKPWLLRFGKRLLDSSQKEVFHYIDEHFGHKLRAQHHAMIADVLEMCAEKGVKADALVEMRDRLIEVST